MNFNPGHSGFYSCDKYEENSEILQWLMSTLLSFCQWCIFSPGVLPPTQEGQCGALNARALSSTQLLPGSSAAPLGLLASPLPARSWGKLPRASCHWRGDPHLESGWLLCSQQGIESLDRKIEDGHEKNININVTQFSGAALFLLCLGWLFAV